MPLPEGWQYLGFIFARAETPEAVEQALREAHGRLTFDIDPPGRRRAAPEPRSVARPEGHCP